MLHFRHRLTGAITLEDVFPGGHVIIDTGFRRLLSAGEITTVTGKDRSARPFARMGGDMGKSYLMAFDLGGGSGRCLLVDVETGDTYSSKRNWSYSVAPNTAGLGYDLDLEDMWRKLGEACRQVMEEAGAGPQDVQGVAATSMRNTTVLLDADDRVLFATPNQDGRALGDALMLAGERGMEFYEAGGHWPGPIFTAPRLIWLRNNAPEVLERTVRTACLSDWVGFRLSGNLYAERSQAGETMLFDQRKRDWAADLIESLGVSADIFPETVDAGTRIGELSREVAGQLGLAAGIPVAAGGADTQCGLLGAGCTREGDIGAIAGTSMSVQQVCSDYVLDGEGRLWSGQHVIPGLYVLESNGLLSGTVLDWFSRILRPDSDDPLAVLFAEAARSEPGAAGVYSTFGAHVGDARSINVILGSLTMSHMVTPDTLACRNHISRALLEGIAYSAWANIAQVIEVSGMDPDVVDAGGGMSRSALWTQIVADVAGKAVRVYSVPENSALGAVVCAGVGSGVFADLVEGAERIVSVEREQPPGADCEKYQTLYAGWREAMDKRTECDSCTANQMAVAMFSRAPAACEAPPAFRPRILVTASMDESALGELREMGEVDFRPWREKMSVLGGGRELADELEGYDIFITEMDVVDFEALEALAGLKMIICCRVNAVNVDMEAATAFGIPVANTPGRNADAVADLTVAFMIMLARGLPGAAAFLKQGGGEAGDIMRMAQAYEAYLGSELWRKTVGLVGLGNVGARVASRLRPFGAEVLFYDPGLGAGEGIMAGAEKVSLEELLRRSDFVSVHAPASEATENLMDGEAFSLMKEGAFFINTARASLVDDEALAEALERGKLAGAALDVFTVEPPAPDDRLAGRLDVIATPHIGGNTREIGAHQGDIAADQLRKMLRGTAPDHILNPEVLEGFDWTGPRREPPPEELERLARNPKPSITS
jgi:sugar (pentulose or hexulose) kinase/phosphoglycerate dehydrogenase-like enzyme